MTGIPEPRFRQADHPRLKVNEWRPDAGAEDLGGGILMSKSVTNCFVVASDAGVPGFLDDRCGPVRATVPPRW